MADIFNREDIKSSLCVSPPLFFRRFFFQAPSDFVAIRAAGRAETRLRREVAVLVEEITGGEG